jgi:hypothetical protein
MCTFYSIYTSYKVDDVHKIKRGGTLIGDPWHSIMIMLRGERSGVRIPVETRDKSLFHVFQTGSTTHLASYSIGIWISFLGDKAVGT